MGSGRVGLLLAQLPAPVVEGPAALALIEPTPDAVRLLHGQRVVAALHDDRALVAYLLRLVRPVHPGVTALVLRMEEHRAVLAPAGTETLPVPRVRHGTGE